LNFNKYSVKRKQHQLVAKGQRNERRVFISAFKLLLALFVLLVVVMAGAGFGMIKGILDNAPDINSISIKPKGFKTTIMNMDGTKEVDSLSTVNSNRIYVYYSEIPRQLVDAFVSIEDERFWEHNGIDIKGIFRAGVRLITTRNADQGASTITQQLIKNQVFNVGMNESTFMQRLTRKIQEQYLAIELEKKYTKEQILEYYLNTIYLGQGVNGVEAAAKRYFNKSVGQLNLSEITVIAGITQNPYRYDPVVFPEYNAQRRELVLYKMLELGYIDEATLKATLADNVYDRVQMVAEVRKVNASYNSWFMDALMLEFVEDLQKVYGITEEEAYTEMYSGGYTIYSTQDFEIQKICDTVLNTDDYFPNKNSVGLDYKLDLLDPDGVTQYHYDHNSLVSYNQVLTGNPKYNNIYPNEEMARAAADTYKEAMIENTGGTFLEERFNVSKQPQISFSVIEPSTGYIKAIVGGRGEKIGNLTWNRATMSERQPGSTFKVLAAFGPYIDTGGCLATSFDDAPYKYVNGVEVSNWYKGYRGVNNLRVAIMNSMNIIAVKAITDLTPEVAYQYLVNEGFTTVIDQYTTRNGSVLSDINQSLALGGITFGVNNVEITAAYAAIANMGLYRKPVYYTQVYDHEGNLVIDNRDANDPARTHRVFKETTAWQLIEAMRDVVTKGTGKTARMTEGYNVGKTGTTSDSYDLWFCGFTPYYAASIWYGYDSNVDNGNVSNHQAMWRDIMDQISILEGQDQERRWNKPDGITTVKLCGITNKLAGEECPESTDLCATDALPTERCGGHEMIEICKESHHIATNTCPEPVKYAVQMDDDGKKTLVGATFEYDQTIFTIPCPLHPAQAEEMSINTSCTDGGSITPSMNVEPESSVTVYISPFLGYMIGDVTVDGVSVGAVSSYTFNTVTEPHTIHATFVSNGIVPEPPTPPEPDPPTPPEDPGEGGGEEP